MLRIRNAAGEVVAGFERIVMVAGTEGGSGTPRSHVTADSGEEADLVNVRPSEVADGAGLTVLRGPEGRILGVEPASVVSVTGEDHDVPVRRFAWVALRGKSSRGRIDGMSPAGVLEALFGGASPGAETAPEEDPPVL